MPLIVCDNCRTIDNTACCQFWSRDYEGLPEKYQGKALCCVCMAPEFLDGSKDIDAGRWHERFPQRIATLEVVREIGINNFIYVGKFYRELTNDERAIIDKQWPEMHK